MEKKRYKVLVAEDDPFQRLSIIDILKVTYYDVTPVENGDQAIEVLKEEGSNFDIVLLDLLMPKMSGKDVLEFIMKDKRLRKIPVIVMSARNDKSIVSSWLKAGAKSFIIKPLRVQEWRSFVKYIETSNETDTEQSLSKYTSIKVLGAGASGTVELVKHKETDKLFALKTIPLTNLNEKERSSAELEVHFLKVLNGPTLIKSYQSYIEEENIYIIMEYAEGGSLDDKIKFAKLKKQPFEVDTILNWISQVILGVMLMHSKNILHRDLKCQNIFVTKDGVLKIGDFGISKELESMTKMVETNIGTPYFMAPEAWKGEWYGEKADVWAIGVILYELTMLKKPFDAGSVKDVFDKIINTPIDFSETHIDVEIKMLIIAMLDKDQLNRPSIWELSNFTCINERINKFVQEQKWEDSVSSVFEWRSIQEEEKEKEGKDIFFQYLMKINLMYLLI